MSNEIRTRRGDTFSWACPRIPLPAGSGWTATCSFQHKGACYHIGATLTLIGPTSGDPTRNDYALALLAPASATVDWPTTSDDYGIKVQAAIRFTSDDPTPIVRTSESFPIVILKGGC